MIRNHFARRFLLCSDGSPRYPRARRQDDNFWAMCRNRWGTPQSVAPPNHHFVGKLSPKGRTEYPALDSKEASNPAHQLGSCVDLATVHEDSASFFVCSGELITSDCHTR